MISIAVAISGARQNELPSGRWMTITRTGAAGATGAPPDGRDCRFLAGLTLTGGRAASRSIREIAPAGATGATSATGATGSTGATGEDDVIFLTRSVSADAAALAASEGSSARDVPAFCSSLRADGAAAFALLANAASGAASSNRSARF